MDIKGICIAILKGLIDSFRGMLVIFYLDKEINERKLSKRSPSRSTLRQRITESRDATPVRQLKEHEESTVTKKVTQCTLLNGGILLASILVFEYGFLPLLGALVYILSGKHPLFLEVIWYWVETLCSLLFKGVWVIPLFFISKVINAFWFQDIADSAYKNSRGRPVVFQSISALCADSIFSLVVQSLFVVQTALTSYIPINHVGFVLSFAQTCLLYSLYAFEYKWINMGWELHRRLAFIEANWPYFLGFGFPLAFITQLPDSLIKSACLFSILFPLYILSGNEATPVTGVSDDLQVRFFSPVIATSNFLFSKMIGKPKRVAPATGTTQPSNSQTRTGSNRR